MRYICLALFTIMLYGQTAWPQPDALPGESSTDAVPRQIEYPWMSLDTWYERHQADTAIAEKGGIEVLFLGDSITESWGSGKNSELFDMYFGAYATANFAIGGDQTQHVLWRLQNGDSGNLRPKLCFLMVGVNNFGHSNHSAEEVYQGIAKISEQVFLSFPDTILLLHGILPNGANNSAGREKARTANKMIATIADGKRIIYADFGDIFLDGNGNIPREIMPDGLHPSYRGLELFGQKLSPLIHRLMAGEVPGQQETGGGL